MTNLASRRPGDGATTMGGASPPHAPSRHALVRDWLLVFSGSFVGQIVGAFVGLANAILLGPASLGVVKLAHTITSWAARSDFGLTKALQRQIPIECGRGNRAGVERTTHLVFTESLISSVVFLGLLWTAWAAGLTFDGLLRADVLGLASMLILLDRVGILMDALATAEGRFDIGARRDIITALLAPCLLPLVAWLGITGLLLGEVLFYLVAITYTWRRLRPHLRLALGRLETWALLRVGMPMWLNSVSQKGLATSEILILPWFVSPSELGIFAFAAGMLPMAALLPQSLHGVLLRHIGVERGSKDGIPPDYLRRWFGQPLTGYQLVATLSAGTILAGYLLLIRTVLDAFAPAETILPLVAVAAVFSGIAGFIAPVLNMMDRLSSFVKLQALMLVAGIALDLAVIPSFGVTGAAIAFSLTYVLRAVGSLWLARSPGGRGRAEAAWSVIRDVGRSVAAIAISGLGLWALDRGAAHLLPGSGSSVWSFLAQAAVTVAVCAVFWVWTVATFALLYRRQGLLAWVREMIHTLRTVARRKNQHTPANGEAPVDTDG